MTRSAPVLLALSALLGAGCSGGEPAAQPAAPTTPATAAATAAALPTAAAEPTCGQATASRARWPEGVPADLPVPPTAQLGTTESTAQGLTLVRFTTQQSVRQGVVFLASALQPAGYTLGRGDAEAIEADVPFSKGPLRGLFKMIAEQPCSTQWILALQSATAPAAGATSAPLVPPVTSTSPSPLPFG